MGYKFRIEPRPNKIFYDIDINLGFKHLSHRYYFFEQINDSSSASYGQDGPIDYLYTSLNASFNYRISEKAHLGLGIEPTFYYEDGRSANNGFSFDLPATAKVAYDLGLLEISLAYKYGMLRTVKSDIVKFHHLSDWQIGLFIPF